MNKIKEVIKYIKKNYSKFKMIWSNTKKRAGIKLLLYFILFLIVFLFAGISSRLNNDSSNNKIKTTATTKIVENFSTIIKNFTSNNHNINYVIKLSDTSYKINGTLKNNIIEGYLESDTIIKIKFKDNILFEVKNDIEIPLTTSINTKLIDISNVLNLLDKERSIISEKHDKKEYSYNVKYEDNNYNIIVYVTNDKIYSIKINGVNIEYELNFDN